MTITHLDMPDLPEFLRRPPPSAEDRKRMARRYGREARTKIKNPRKHPSKQSRLLGLGFGVKIVRS